MSPSAGYPTAPPPAGNDVGNIAAADARRMHGINPGICRLAAVNVKIRIKPPEPGNRPHQHLVGVKAVPASTRAPERLPPSAGQTPGFAFVDNNADIAAHVIVKHYADVQLRIARHKQRACFCCLVLRR